MIAARRLKRPNQGSVWIGLRGRSVFTICGFVGFSAGLDLERWNGVVLRRVLGRRRQFRSSRSSGEASRGPLHRDICSGAVDSGTAGRSTPQLRPTLRARAAPEFTRVAPHRQLWHQLCLAVGDMFKPVGVAGIEQSGSTDRLP